MFYDELMDFTENDYDGDSLNSLKKGKKPKESIKSYDKGFHKIVRKLTDDNNKVNKKITVEGYSTGQLGNNIRNALTGEYTKYKVGSKEQSLFFKVSNCIGLNSAAPVHFYYKSPEEYERHQFSKVDKVVKDKWMEKYVKIKKATLEKEK
jgi:hypothetical protein